MVPHLLTGSCNSCWFLDISYFWGMSSGLMSIRAAPRETFGGRWKTRQCHPLAPLTRCGVRHDRSVSSGPRSHFSLVWCSRQSGTPRAPRPDHPSPRRIYGADGRRSLRDFQPHLCGNRAGRLARLSGIANAASSRLHLLSSPGRRPCLYILGTHHRQELSRHPHAQFLCRSHRLSDRGPPPLSGISAPAPATPPPRPNRLRAPSACLYSSATGCDHNKKGLIHLKAESNHRQASMRSLVTLSAPDLSRAQPRGEDARSEIPVVPERTSTADLQPNSAAACEVLDERRATRKQSLAAADLISRTDRVAHFPTR